MAHQGPLSPGGRGGKVIGSGLPAHQLRAALPFLLAKAVITLSIVMVSPCRHTRSAHARGGGTSQGGARGACGEAKRRLASLAASLFAAGEWKREPSVASVAMSESIGEQQPSRPEHQKAYAKRGAARRGEALANFHSGCCLRRERLLHRKALEGAASSCCPPPRWSRPIGERRERAAAQERLLWRSEAGGRGSRRTAHRPRRAP